MQNREEIRRYGEMIVSEAKHLAPQFNYTVKDVSDENGMHVTAIDIILNQERYNPFFYPRINLDKNFDRKHSPTDMAKYIAGVVTSEDFEIQIQKRKSIAEQISNFDNIKDKLSVKVINLDRALREAKYNDFLFNSIDETDLAAQVYIDIDDEKVIITKYMLSCYDMSVDELFESALKSMNNRAEDQPYLIKLSEVIFKILSASCPEGMTFSEEDLPYMDMNFGYVLTCKDPMLSNTYGAKMLFRNDILEDFYKEHGPFYIIPSSVHELLLVPDDVNDAFHISPDDIKDLIKTVNSEEVAPGDKLSDNLFRFSGKKITKVC